jgi:chromate reductase, NAD(P)H dehydrogenase (quinone)
MPSASRQSCYPVEFFIFARAQYHPRQSCVFLNMHPLNKPEVTVIFAQDKIDKNGKLAEEKTREIISQLLTNLLVWTRRLN